MTAKKKEITPEVAKPETEEETIRGTQSTARLSIWIAVVIISIALIGYLTSRSSFKAEDVAAGISTATEDIAGYLEEGGFEGAFSYESLALQGSIFSRVAVVQHPEFVLRNAQTGEEMRITTEYVVIDPKSAAMGEFSLMLDKPVTVSKGDAEYKIIQKLPVKIAIAREATAEDESIKYAMNYPEGMGFIIQVSGVGGETEDSSYQLHVGGGSLVKGVLDLKERSYYEESDLKDVAAEFSQSIAKVQALKMVFEEAGHDGSRFRHYKMDGEALTFVGPYQGIGKLDAAMEVEEELPQGEATESRNVSLTNLSIKGEDFSISGQGQMELRPAEILPYGTMETEVSSSGALLDRLGNVGVLPEGTESLVAGVLERAASPTQDENVMHLNFQRTPGGAFMIGNQTFEELAVSLLSDVMRGAKPQPVAPAPASDAPKDDVGQPMEEEEIAPVEDMPDSSVPETGEDAALPEEGEGQAEDAPPVSGDTSDPMTDESEDALRKAREALEQLKQQVAPIQEEAPAAEAPGEGNPEAIAPPSDEVAPSQEAPVATEKKTDE